MRRHQESEKLKNKFVVKDDPYLRRKQFVKTLNGVYDTDAMLQMHKSANYCSSKTPTREEVLEASKKMHKLNCDRDKRYFSNVKASDPAPFNRTMISVKSGVSIPDGIALQSAKSAGRIPPRS